MMARALYTALWLVALPFAWGRLMWRGRAEAGYRIRWAERFTLNLPAKPTQRLIWLHAVSLGETRAAAPLLAELLKLCPEHVVLFTHSTATGRAEGETLAAQHHGRIVQSWLPYDTTWFASRFFTHFRPELGIVMETEVWPNLMHAAHAGGVRMALVNARLSEKSARGYARWPALTRPAFSAFDRVLAQSEADAARLTSAGATQVEVMGNVKFDMALNEVQFAQGREWRTHWNLPIVVGASTREGEEALLLAAWRAMGLNAHRKVTLMIVPRHPQRFNEVAALVKAQGFELLRRSDTAWSSVHLALRGDDTVLLGDSLGEMAMYYGLADVVIMGGSLLSYGSQNLIEACAAGCPVILGPSIFNFAQAAVDAVACGAAVQVGAAAGEALTSSAQEAVSARALQQALELACSPERAAPMRRAALALSLSHQGAATRQALALQALLPQAYPPARH